MPYPPSLSILSLWAVLQSQISLSLAGSSLWAGVLDIAKGALKPDALGFCLALRGFISILSLIKCLSLIGPAPRFSPGPFLPTVSPWTQFIARLSRVAVAKLQLNPTCLTNEPLRHHFPPPHLHPALHQTSIFPTPLLPVLLFPLPEYLLLEPPGSAPRSCPIISYPKCWSLPFPFLYTPACSCWGSHPCSLVAPGGQVLLWGLSETPDPAASSLSLCPSTHKTKTLVQVLSPCSGTAVQCPLSRCLLRFFVPAFLAPLAVESRMGTKVGEGQKSRAWRKEERSPAPPQSFAQLE